MSFESITKGIWKGGRPKGSGHPSLLTIAGRKGCKSPSGYVIYQSRLAFRIALELWQKAEYEPGQKVEVLFDRDKSLGLIRITDHGYTMTVSSPSGDGSYDLKFSIPHNAETGFPFFPEQTGMADIEVKNGEIFFRIPILENPTFSSLGKSHQGNGEFQEKQKKIKK